MLGKDIDHVQSIQKILIRTHPPAMIIVDKRGELYNAVDRDHCMQYIVTVISFKGQLIEASDYPNDSAWAWTAREDGVAGGRGVHQGLL